MTPDVLPRRAGLLRFPTLWLFLHLRTTQYGFGNLFSTHESFDPPSPPAAEVRVIPASHFYIKFMVFAADRAPYAHNPTGFVPQFHGDPISVSEIGYSPGRRASAVRALDNVEARKGHAGLYRFGGAYNPGMLASTSSNKPVSGNYLIYGMASQALNRTRPDTDRGIDLTIGADWTPPDKSRNNPLAGKALDCDRLRPEERFPENRALQVFFRFQFHATV